MANQNLFSHITEATPDVARTIDAASICTSILILIIGVVLFFSSFQFGPDADELSMLCLLLGLFGTAFGLIMIAVRNKKLVYLPTGKRLKKTSVYFSRNDTEKVMQLAENRIKADALPKSNANGTVRIDMMHSSDGAFAAAQVHECKDYMYDPTGAIHIYTGDVAKDFIEKMKQTSR